MRTDLSIAPSQSLTLVFLADGSNDRVVDEGDPMAVLGAPELADLQAGDRVHIADAALDFHARRVTAAVEVARSGEPAVTPTALPKDHGSALPITPELKTKRPVRTTLRL